MTNSSGAGISFNKSLPEAYGSIYDIKPYVGGNKFPKDFVKKVFLASNENPYGTPQAVVDFLSNYSNYASYPDGAALELVNALAQKHELPANQIICGSGSEELLHLLCKVFVTPGSDVIMPKYGFNVYRIAALSCGANPVFIQRNDDYSFSVDDILSSVTANTKLVFLDHPGNPIPFYLKKDEILRLCQELPSHIVLVIDGAYSEFMAGIDDYDDGIELVKKFPNVVVTRSFSKAYGLAALRLGWMFAQENIIDPLNRVRAPFNTTSLSQKAGVFAIKDDSWLKMSIEKNRKCLVDFCKELDKLHLEYMASSTNFVLVKFDKTQEVYQKLGRQGVIVRPMGAYELNDFLRISIGTKDQMKQAVVALSNAISSS